MIIYCLLNVTFEKITETKSVNYYRTNLKVSEVSNLYKARMLLTTNFQNVYDRI